MMNNWINSELGTKFFLATAIALSLGSVILASGCNDDSADMAAQIQARGGSGKGGAVPTNTTESVGGKKTMPGKPGGAAPEMPGKAGKPGETPAAGDAAAKDAEALPEGPEFELLVKNIKAPYPRFSGAGYYDFDVEVTVHDTVPAKVWEIQAVDETGKVLGSEKQMMVFSKDRMKEFAFRGFYCSKMPTDVKLIYTGKDAIPVDTEDTSSHGGGKGAGLGGGSGAGAGGGAGAGKGSGGGGKTGGDDGGKKDGGDEGGEEGGEESPGT